LKNECNNYIVQKCPFCNGFNVVDSNERNIQWMVENGGSEEKMVIVPYSPSESVETGLFPAKSCNREFNFLNKGFLCTLVMIKLNTLFIWLNEWMNDTISIGCIIIITVKTVVSLGALWN